MTASTSNCLAQVLLAAALLLLCIGAVSSEANLVVQGSTSVIPLVEGKDNNPRYVLDRAYKNVLQCSMYASNGSQLVNPKIDWQLDFNKTLDQRFTFVAKLSEDKKNFTSTMSIVRPENKFVANYSCRGSADGFSPEVGVAHLESQPLISFKVENETKSDVAVWPGQDVELTCVVEGNPPGTTEWRREKDDSPMGNDTASIHIKGASYDGDRGFYLCSSKNKYGVNSAKIFLRVKHPQAYLTPLIIIIVEIIIMAIVVAVYEFLMARKRKQAEADGAAYKTD